MAKPIVDELLPVAVVAERWHCSKNLIYDLIASGKLAAVQLTTGRAKTRIAASELAAYIERQSRRAPRTSGTGRAA